MFPNKDSFGSGICERGNICYFVTINLSVEMGISFSLEDQLLGLDQPFPSCSDTFSFWVISMEKNLLQACFSTAPTKGTMSVNVYKDGEIEGF